MAMAVYFEIRDKATGEVLREANTYSGGGGSGIISEQRVEVKNWPHDSGLDVKRLSYWDTDDYPDQWASEITGRDAELVATYETDDMGNIIRRYDADGFAEDGYDWQGYDRDGLNEDGHEKCEEYFWDKDILGNDVRRYESDVDDRGFWEDGMNVNGTFFDDNGYDEFGRTPLDPPYNAHPEALKLTDGQKKRLETIAAEREGSQGATRKCEEGKAPYDDRRPRDDEGYDWNGFDRYGIHRDTGTDRDEYGRDIDGYDEDGYDWDGLDRNGYDREGYDIDGWTVDGYRLDENGVERDKGGFDRDGFNEDGYDVEGYDWDGFDSEGYDERGYDADGYDRDGYDERGYDRDGYFEGERPDDQKAAGYDPLAGNEPLWSSDDGFHSKGDIETIAISEDGFGGAWKKAKDVAKGIGTTLGGFAGAARRSMEAPKTGDIDVSAYDYTRNGKRVHVDAYKRKRSK